MKMKKSMKAMKAMKAGKAMKSMKKRAMKKSAKAYKTKAGAMRAVFTGKIGASKGGLKKDALIKNKNGRIVSKKMSARGKASKWIKAVTAARKALGIKAVTAAR